VPSWADRVGHAVVVSDTTETAAEMMARLDGLRTAVGQSAVTVRVDHENTETVYLEVDGGSLVVHDRGETFYYLAVEGPATDDPTFKPWSSDEAAEVARAVGVDLEDESDEDGEGFRLGVRVAPHADVGQAVDRVAEAISEVFAAHVVEGD
jgi:hypothetical protein